MILDFFKKKSSKKHQDDIPMYVPRKKRKPVHTLKITSAWKGLELIIEDIIEQFNLPNGRCIEFGVEFGYSAVVFSNYFGEVTGVDTFEGDIHTSHKGNHYEHTKNSLAGYPNIHLHRAMYQDWIKNDHSFYDLAHVDIIHTYEDTFACGLWAAQHSKCTIFHDTESFPEVRRAVIDVAKATGKNVYNYPYHHGLGIVC